MNEKAIVVPRLIIYVICGYLASYVFFEKKFIIKT